MPVCASTPTGPVEQQPAAGLGLVGVRARRSGSGCGRRRRRGGSATASAAPCTRPGDPCSTARRRRPVLGVVEGDVLPAVGRRDVLGVLASERDCSYWLGVQQPAGPGGDVDDERRPARGSRTPAGASTTSERFRPATSVTPNDRRAPAPQATPAARTPPAGRRPPTWCRRPGPSRRPAASSQGRNSSAADRAPARRRRSARGTSRAIRARHQSRSATRQCTAHSTKNATKMSSRASRESTNCRPSKQSSSPATQPSSVEPVSRRTSRIITRIISVPTTAGTTRQPNGSMPNIFSPSADQPLADLGVDHHRRRRASRGRSVCPARMCLLALPPSLST